MNSCSPFGKALLRIILPLWLPLPFPFRLFLYSRRFSLTWPAAWEKLPLPPWKFGMDESEAGCFRLGKRSPWESCLPGQTPLHFQLFKLSLKELRSISQGERKSDLGILIQYRQAIKTYSVLLFKGQIIKSFFMSSLQKKIFIILFSRKTKSKRFQGWFIDPTIPSGVWTVSIFPECF